MMAAVGELDRERMFLRWPASDLLNGRVRAKRR